MGFAKSDQLTGGIHTRLYSRAFLFQTANNTKGGNGRGRRDDRVVFVSVDVGMIGQMVKRKVNKSKSKEEGG